MDWHPAEFEEHDSATSDPLRHERARFRREMQWRVPAAVVAGFFIWWASCVLASLAWRAVCGVARRLAQAARYLPAALRLRRSPRIHLSTSDTP